MDLDTLKTAIALNEFQLDESELWYFHWDIMNYIRAHTPQPVSQKDEDLIRMIVFAVFNSLNMVK